jgi:large subunit ribosomal protein L25
MKDNFDLIAELREDQGKGASRRLRHQGQVPAIIYGAGRPPRSLSFDQNKVLQKLENESFYSSILNIKVNDKSQAAILKDLQRHPAKNMIMHMDFQRIVEVSCLPKNLPEYLEVDVSELELDAMLSLTDIKLPEGVEIVALAQGPENDQGIVSIHVIKAAPIEEEIGDEEALGEEVAGEEPADDATGEESSSD